jgi:hypothetical protein
MCHASQLRNDFSPKSSSSYISDKFEPIKKYPPGFEPSELPIGYGRKKYNQLTYEFDEKNDKEIINMVDELLKDSGSNKRSRRSKSKNSKSRRRKKSTRSKRSKSSRSRKIKRTRSRMRKSTRSRKIKRTRSRMRKSTRIKSKRSRNKKYKVNEDDIKFIKKQSVIGLKSYIKSKGLKGYTKFNKEQLINFILKKIDIDTGKLL